MVVRGKKEEVGGRGRRGEEEEQEKVQNEDKEKEDEEKEEEEREDEGHPGLHSLSRFSLPVLCAPGGV